MSGCNSNSKGGRGRVADPVDLQKWIYPIAVPGKGKVPMLKVLQTNVCKNRCSYCAFSASHDHFRRVSIAPEDLARAFMDLAHRKLVYGIFLSSGIPGHSDSAMEQMLKTAEILRLHYGFEGYIHLKALPGCSYDRMEWAMQLADRVSLNIEAASVQGLKRLAPDKELKGDLLKRLYWAGQMIQQRRTRAGSQTTQLVVGPSGEKDHQILQTVDWVYRKLNVFRSFYSAYQPPTDKDPPGEPMARMREHRLYQSDFLLRTYGFKLKDLVVEGQGSLPLHWDPKTAHAMMNPGLFPVEVNRAEKWKLLRVPGIGPLGASRIMEQRLKGPLRTLNELALLGVLTQRAAPWILLDGKRPSWSRQPWLFQDWESQGWKMGIKSLN